jgi:predicted AlkP superfamily pyrophosphatase or phosphodiesterase
MVRTVVLNVVGLTRSLLSERTPNLNALLANSAGIQTITPAVTCPVQATYLTGWPPSEHGIVGNGWYFHSLSEVMFWKQSNRLVQGEKIWHEARRRNSSFTCANTGWWFNMATDADYVVTPRPVYCSDGRKLPDCYTIPPDLRQRFNSKFGQFPLFQFWGPGTSIVSSEWLAKAAMAVEEDFSPTLHLIYLPHLDYILQRVGPSGDLQKDLREIDELCGRLMDFFQNRGCRVVVLSEYSVTDVKRPVHPNRLLRSLGHLALKVDLGREYLDFGRSRAFSVSDHQVAHIYINDKAIIPQIRECFEQAPGIEQVLGEDGKKAYRLDHPRSGDLVLISEKDAWFTYYYWENDSRAPDFARTVNIHAKPGYDPCELFLDPGMSFPKLKIARTLLKKKLGFRYLLEVIPLDATLVRGSHGRVTDRIEDGPIFMTTEPVLLNHDCVRAEEIFELILAHIFSE